LYIGHLSVIGHNMKICIQPIHTVVYRLYSHAIEMGNIKKCQGIVYAVGMHVEDVCSFSICFKSHTFFIKKCFLYPLYPTRDASNNTSH